MDPLVSVILPTYNRSSILRRTVKSVMSQEYGNLELIIVDDASTDDTQSVIDSFKDKRIQLFRLPGNVGVSAARNMGIKKASGEYLAFLDSDDEFTSDKLTRTVEVFQEVRPEPGMVFSNLRKSGRKKIKVPKAPASSGFVDLSRFPGSVFFGPTTWVLSREALEKVGFFDENLKRNEDTDFFARAVRRVPVCFLDEPLANIHVHDLSAGRDIDDIADEIRFYILKNWFSEMKKDRIYLSDFYYCAGKHHVRKKQFAKALPWLWKALLTDPMKPRTYAKLSKALAGSLLRMERQRN